MSSTPHNHADPSERRQNESPLQPDHLAGEARNGEATRNRIMRLVHGEPGIHTLEISTRLGLAWSTVAYHLRVLTRERRVSVVKELRERRAFPPETPARYRRWLSTLRDDEATKVLEALLERPGQSVSELSSHLGFTPRIVRRCLTNLKNAEIIDRRGNLRPVYEAREKTASQLVLRQRPPIRETLGQNLEPPHAR